MNGGVCVILLIWSPRSRVANLDSMTKANSSELQLSYFILKCRAGSGFCRLLQIRPCVFSGRVWLGILECAFESSELLVSADSLPRTASLFPIWPMVTSSGFTKGQRILGKRGQRKFGLSG